eukprot:4140966-Amphidinium_carterae.1
MCKIVPPPKTPQQERNHQSIKKERILRTSNIGFSVEGCFPVPTLGSTLGPGSTAAAASASTEAGAAVRSSVHMGIDTELFMRARVCRGKLGCRDPKTLGSTKESD